MVIIIYKNQWDNQLPLEFYTPSPLTVKNVETIIECPEG